MPRKCVVLHCFNNYLNRGERQVSKVSYHEVPSNENQKNLWLKQLKPYMNPYSRSELFHVCGDHFEENCFIPSKRRVLTRNAVPTIFHVPETPTPTTHTPILLNEDSITHNDPESAVSEEYLSVGGGVDNETVFISCGQLPIPVEEQQNEENSSSKYLFNSVKIYSENGQKEICRVCFKVADQYKKLTNRHITRTQSYQEMMEFLSLEVNYDFYPDPVICLKCVMMLLNAYDFKKKCLKTEKSLQKFYSNRASTDKLTNLVIIGYGRKKETKTESDNNEIILDNKTTEYSEKGVSNGHTNEKTSNDEVICNKTDEKIDTDMSETRGSIVETKELEKDETKQMKKYGEIELDTEHYDEDHIDLFTEIKQEPRETQVEPKIELNTKPTLSYHKKYKRIAIWGDPPYLCDMCGRMFQSKRQCRRHLRIHMIKNETVETYTCHICKFTYNNINVALHLDSHREKKYRCSFCERQFDKQNLMLTHIQAVHEKEPYVNCDTCGKKCLRKKLSSHVSRHFDSKDAQCHICDKKVYRLYLKQHIRKHFSAANRSRSVCHICGKSVINCFMKAHIRKHTETPKYNCKFCDIGFFTEKELRLHCRRKKHIRNLMLHEVTKERCEDVRMETDHTYATLSDAVDGKLENRDFEM